MLVCSNTLSVKVDTQATTSSSSCVLMRVIISFQTNSDVNYTGLHAFGRPRGAPVTAITTA